MALLTLTHESIKKICESASGQEAIAKLTQEMNRQGITKMFIDYEKVRALVKRMEKDGICQDSSANFSDETLDEILTGFLTEKVIEFLELVEDIEKKPIIHGLPMLKELVGYYLLNPYQPMKVFYWMGEYALPFKVDIQNTVNMYFMLTGASADKHAMYNDLINDAIPLGINSEVHALAWVRANEEDYAKLDFKKIFEAINFDRYYFEAFEKDPDDKACCNREGEHDPMKFVPKSEIKILADEGFKPLVLDVVFQEAKSLSVPDINTAIMKLFEERPALVYMLYARAMFFAKASELQRFQKEIMKVLDANGISYSLIPNQVDPRMFQNNPWSGNFS